ncbi:MAG: sterol desaturase family protein [Deltaproteobacteria bacterium]|nr:sterol desaturase family protein [Deltaproteobacteria bacterium]
METFLLIHFLLPLAPHLCPHIPGEETLQAWANRSPALVRDVWLIILPLVLTDLSFYVAHRLAHKIPLFWRFHKAHHSAETLTPFTAQRSHFLDVLYFRAFHHAASAAALLLTQKVVPGNALFLSAGILLGQWLMRIGNALNHSPIQVTYGRVLGWVFMNSTLHAVHHGRSLHHIDKNFGVLFSFFDRVFSTYYRPAPTESIQLGLSDHSESAYHSLFGFYWTPFRTGSANSRTNQGGRRIVEKKETVLFGHTFLTEE